MDTTVHNPDQYMFDFRHIITNGRKKIGLLVGAGAPVSINVGTNEEFKPLIPNVAGLTEIVRKSLAGIEKEAFIAIEGDLGESNIELALSRIRGLAEVIGDIEVHNLNGEGYKILSKTICEKIKEVVEVDLPDEANPFSNLISWVNGISRKYAVEIFTTNYDLLFEEAMERSQSPYFDGFVGSKTAFFDAASISNNNLPSNWIRLWKLHGSVGWSKSKTGEVVRDFSNDGEIMVYPSHVKYDQTQSAPFTSLFDRLKGFLLEPDSLLIVSGFSFFDHHISAKLTECMLANQTCAIIALQYKKLDEEPAAVRLAEKRSNMSIYCRDGAVINGVRAKWKLGEEPAKNWANIREEYWKDSEFTLGDFAALTHFLAKSGGEKTHKEIPLAIKGEVGE